MLGEKLLFNISYDISNKGDPAYEVKMSIDLPKKSTFKIFPKNCNVKDLSMTCNLTQRTLLESPENTSQAIQIEIRINEIETEKTIIVAKVFSATPERNEIDNTVTTTLQFTSFSEIEING